MKQTLKSLYTIVLVTLLVACETITPMPTVRVVATTLPLLTVTSPISTASPTPSASPIHPITNTATPTFALPISSAPDGLRMAYELDGNLYFQDGSKPPLQLISNGEDSRPLFFSENKETMFFLRGVRGQGLYSINIDGSQERALVTNNLLLTFSPEYDESTTPCDPVLVPHTNLILFRTCSHPVVDYIIQTIYNDDLFVVNTDTNQLKYLLPRGMGGTFYVSPNGKMLAIDRLNSLDILDIDGKIIHREVATYSRSEPIPVHSFVYWTADSSGLVVALPINTFYDTSLPPTYKIWHYSLDTNVGAQFDFDPPPMSHEPMWVSPDGNWITYNNRDERYFYLGNLRNGSAKAYEMALPYDWSPDSVHFVYEVSRPGGSDLYLASVNAPPVFVGKGEFIGWLDASRYVYFTDQMFVMGEIGKEPTPILVGNTQHLYSYASLIFTFQP